MSNAATRISLAVAPRRWADAALAALAVSACAQPGDKLSTQTADLGPPKLYVVGYSHLDTQWCWTYPQVIREFIPNTLHENFALFEKYPDYTFNWTGSNRYRFMKEYYPEDYAKLKQYIAAGRWFPAGSSIEEGDVNNPSSESLIRQVLYGNQFFRKEFGIASDEYMLPDCFGFPASLPTILNHCGVKGFSTQKLTWGSAVGIPFNVGNWVGPDGTSVVAALNAISYGSDIDDDLSTDPDWIKRLNGDIERTGVGVDYRYYGTGDRGGSPSERSVKNLSASLQGTGPLKIIAGRADRMFNDLTPAQIAKLPSYQGDLELTQHSAGSLTSEATMKRWNAKNELLADATERAAVAADWLRTQPYDRERITDAWLRFLPGQFHDLLAGTALPLAYTYTWNDEVIAMNEFAGVLQSSVGSVARMLDTRADGVPVVVYNPLSFARTDVVTATVTLQEPATRVRVFTADGQSTPCQVLSHKGHSFQILFEAKVPSVGFAVYDVRPATGPGPVSASLRVSREGLENLRYRVTLNTHGDVAGIYDKVARRELLSGPARLVYMHENPREYPAWNMDWSDQQQPPSAVVDTPPTISITENGPVRVALQIVREHRGSKFVQTLRLTNADPNRVEFATRIDWRGKESALKAEFPLAVANSKATYNWGIGTVERPNNSKIRYEVASHGWFDVTDADGKYGVSVLKDTKFGSDKPDDRTVRLTLLYTPGTSGGYQHQGTQDWGRHEIVYALTSHHGGWQNGTQQESLRLSQPLISFTTVRHPGPLGSSFSLAQVSDPQIAIEALKKAEDSDEVIVRLNELAGVAHHGIRIHFAAPVLAAREVDGQERPIGEATIDHGDLVTDTGPYHPRAFAVTLDKSPNASSAAVSTPLELPFNTISTSFRHSKSPSDFDGSGRSIPGELLPGTIAADGVTFKLGPVAEGQQNAVVPNGQQVALPEGKSRKLYVLAAATAGDQRAVFGLGDGSAELKIQAWDGYVGQWDTRLWEGQVPELAYDWSNALNGLVPGYIKRAPIAWYADHRRLADGSDDIYQFCYLYRYTIFVPDEAKSVTLPTNAKVRIMAMTVSSNPADDTHPAQPLYDTIEAPAESTPEVSPAGGHFADRIEVTVGNARYWKPTDRVLVTLDGKDPDADSKVVEGPIAILQPTTLKVRTFDGTGHLGPVRTEVFDVVDTTPPTVLEAHALPSDPSVYIRFSEPVDKASAETVGHYSIAPTAKVVSATLGVDGQTVVLGLDSDLQPTGPHQLSVSGVRDLSPAANASHVQDFAIDLVEPGYSMNYVASLTGKDNGIRVRNAPGVRLPTGPASHWTINAFVYLDAAPADLTIIAGFGSGEDDSHRERFLVAKGNHISFWGSNVDIDAAEPFDIGKWQMITATFDGVTVRVYKNGKEVVSGPASFEEAEPVVRIGPPPAWENGHKFAGKVANLTIWPQALTTASIQFLLTSAPK